MPATQKYPLPLVLLLQFLFVGVVLSLQNTNFEVRKWSSYQAEGEFKVFGQATAAEDRLSLITEGQIAAYSSALFTTRINIKRNFDLSVVIRIQTTTTNCSLLANGFAIGVTQQTDILTPSNVSASVLGLDTSKNLWAASIDAVGDSTEISPNSQPVLGPDAWHISYITAYVTNSPLRFPKNTIELIPICSKGLQRTPVWTNSFANANVLNCTSMRNQHATLRLVHHLGRMYSFFNGWLIGNASVNLETVIEAEYGNLFLSASGVSVASPMTVEVLSLSYRQVLINGDFETDFLSIPSLRDWTPSSFFATAPIPDGSCGPASFQPLENVASSCSIIPSPAPINGSRALLGVVEATAFENSFEVSQLISLPAGNYSAVGLSLVPLFSVQYRQETITPPRNLTILIGGVQLQQFQIGANLATNRVAQFWPLQQVGFQNAPSSAMLTIRANFSDGFNGPAIVGVDAVSVIACAPGESIHPETLRCVDCPTGKVKLGQCDCGSDIARSYNSTSAICASSAASVGIAILVILGLALISIVTYAVYRCIARRRERSQTQGHNDDHQHHLHHGEEMQTAPARVDFEKTGPKRDEESHRSHSSSGSDSRSHSSSSRSYSDSRGRDRARTSSSGRTKSKSTGSDKSSSYSKHCSSRRSSRDRSPSRSSSRSPSPKRSGSSSGSRRDHSSSVSPRSASRSSSSSRSRRASESVSAEHNFAETTTSDSSRSLGREIDEAIAKAQRQPDAPDDHGASSDTGEARRSENSSSHSSTSENSDSSS